MSQVLKLTEISGAPETGLFHDLVEIDARVDAAEGEGIRERWLFGRRIVDEYGEGQLPHGLLDSLKEQTGKSHRELKRRVQFARLAPTEEKLGHAVTQFQSWHALVNHGLPSGLDPLLISETPEWETPQDLFDLLNAEFHFDLDVCATRGNAKCERYFTEADDGLVQEWRGVCWMNPPYGKTIDAWMEKAHESGDAGATVVCLVPARTDTSWWWDHARYGEVRFLQGRLKFGDAESGAPFPSAVVIFGRAPSVKWWEEWRKA